MQKCSTIFFFNLASEMAYQLTSTIKRIYRKASSGKLQQFGSNGQIDSIAGVQRVTRVTGSLGNLYPCQACDV